MYLYLFKAFLQTVVTMTTFGYMCVCMRTSIGILSLACWQFISSSVINRMYANHYKKVNMDFATRRNSRLIITSLLFCNAFQILVSNINSHMEYVNNKKLKRFLVVATRYLMLANDSEFYTLRQMVHILTLHNWNKTIPGKQPYCF